jgi:hypothetical protein
MGSGSEKAVEIKKTVTHVSDQRSDQDQLFVDSADK